MKAKAIADLIIAPAVGLSGYSEFPPIAVEDALEFARSVANDYAGGGVGELGLSELEALSEIGEPGWVDFRLEIALDELSDSEVLPCVVADPDYSVVLGEFFACEVTDEHEGLDVNELFQAFILRCRMEWLKHNVLGVLAPAWADIF